MRYAVESSNPSTADRGPPLRAVRGAVAGAACPVPVAGGAAGGRCSDLSLQEQVQDRTADVTDWLFPPPRVPRPLVEPEPGTYPWNL